MSLPDCNCIRIALLAAVLACAAVPRLSLAGGPERLWPERAPGAVGDEPQDQPSITVYPAPPDKANGLAVVICPGGGYRNLALDHEGKQIAEWVNSLGGTALVLQYRLAPRYRHPAPMQDVQRAIRTVRARAEQWKIDPNRIALIGFSAGGHLASTAATHFDAGKSDSPDPIETQSSRPDYLILCYPVIALATEYVHVGSRDNLFGPNPDRQLVEAFSNERQVTEQSPPTFLFHTTTDKSVVPENSILFYAALRKAGVPAELHIYANGPHGVGLAQKDPALATWPGLCAHWLRGLGALQPD